MRPEKWTEPVAPVILSSMSYLLGLDLGGSSIKAVALSIGGEIQKRQTAEFSVKQEMEWAARIRELVREFHVEFASPPAAIGISAPGLAAHDRRSIAFMPGRLQGLEGLDWTTFFGVPTLVPVLNDAHAALVGETSVGAAAGMRNVIMVTLGTGVGGAAMVDGRLLRGAIGRAGHIGHICLDPDGPPGITRVPGSLEYMIGNYSLRERSAGRFESTHRLIDAHLRGDAEATRVWLKSVQGLACGLTSLINVLDPEVIVIGGGIARAGAALFDPLAEWLDKVEWRPGGRRVEIRPAELGDFAGAVGSAWTAQQLVLD